MPFYIFRTCSLSYPIIQYFQAIVILFMMTSFQALITDLNGVLIKRDELLSDRLTRVFGTDAPAFVRALKKVMPVLRMPGAPAAIDVWRPYLADLKIPLSAEEFLAFWLEAEETDDQALELLKNIRRTSGCRMILLSNNFAERTLFYETRFPQVFEPFDAIYFSHRTGYAKPDPRAWENILEEHGLAAVACVFVDDKEKNRTVARSLGMVSCASLQAASVKFKAEL